MLRRKFLLRLKKFKNLHQVDLYDIENVKITIINTDNLSSKRILKFFTALKLATLQQPAFLRLKKTQVRWNLKKGLPIGVFISMHRRNKLNFLKMLKWIIFPQINKAWLLKKENINLSFVINNIFIFSNLKPFYFFFNNFFKIQFFLKFKKKNFQSNLFILKYYQIPFSQ